MSSKILMPSGGQTTDEMLIQKWYKAEGDFVKRGDILFEIETDKAILTVESFAEGTLLEIKFPEGVMVKTGEVVAVIGDISEKNANPKTAVAPQQQVPAEKQPAEKKEIPIDILPGKSLAHKDDKRILASPLAKSFAKIENVRLEDVAGYFSKNLIKKKDVDAFIKNREAVKDLHANEATRYIDTSLMRKTIARRMKESISTAPHYIVAAEIDMTAAVRLRKKMNRQVKDNGIKISFHDIIMKVVSEAITSYPLVNSSYDGDRIKMHTDVNFGLAVALESGLIVPVARQVNTKSISEIAAINAANIEKVKSNKIHEADITGGTITLSNLGMFGVDYFTAIINQPESCILAAGGILKKAVVIEDEIVIREMMNMTGSFDHRIIDGAVAAGFLMKVKSMLEDPELLLF
ncbi:MAG: dihydrolipoamide acetyltransferase family protein [Bacteroidota bacterium]